MKFSATLSLGLASVATAKAVHNVYPVRRDPNKEGSARKSAARQVNAVPAVGAVGGVDPLLLAAQAGLVLGSQRDVIIIWANPGGGAATTTIGAQQTVTQTVTQTGAVGVGAAPGAPPAQVTAPPAALPPVQGAPGASPVAAAPGGSQTHTVNLGGPKGLQFEPPEIKAAVGDMVIFNYLSQNHSATQSAFETPCQPLAGGMDSGFQPNPNNSVNPAPQVAMQVMVDTPLWFFCGQNGHCGKGMVFAINAKPDKTQAMFQQLAIAQNGQGAGSAITGNGGGAPAAAPAPAAPAPAAPPAGETPGAVAAPGVGATGTLQALPGETPGAVAPAPAAGTGVVSGTGTLQNGECVCAVQCQMGAFPAVQAQGIGAFGGQAGALPSNMVAAR